MIKTKAYNLYIALVVALFFLSLILKLTGFRTTGLGITLAFLVLIFLPGFLISRLIEFKEQTLARKILYYSALGLSYHFFWSLFGLVFSLTLNLVIGLSIAGLIVLMGLAIYHDRSQIYEGDFHKWRQTQTPADWLRLVIFSGSALLAFSALNAQVSNYIGDTYFHVAILNKIMTARNLAPANLNPVSDGNLNIVYAFPVWHIFLAVLTKILNLNIFTVYTQLILPLGMLALLVWWGFSRVIFTNKNYATVIYLAFIVYFLSADSFYILVPLRSPDSLNRLLIFPLLLSLTADYLFSPKSKLWVHVGILSLVAIFMGLIHFTQLIEYFMILIIFGIVSPLTINGKNIVEKLGYLILVLAGTILIYVGFFQTAAVRSFITYNLASFRGDTFRNKSYQGTGIFNVYAVFALPLLAIFVRKNQRLLFLGTIALTLMMITWQFFHLRVLFLKIFGEIFATRAITDLPGFIFFGVLILAVVFGLNYLFAKVSRKYFWLIYGLVAITGLIILLSSVRVSLFNFIDSSIFSGKDLLIINRFWPILLLLIILSVGVYLTVKYHYHRTIELPDQTPLAFNFLILTLIIFLVLSLPYLPGYFQKISHNPNGSLVSDRTLDNFGETTLIGADKTITYLKSMSQSDKFIMSNPYLDQIVLLYTPAFTSEYPYGIDKYEYSAKFFEPNLTLNERLVILNNYHINCLIATNPAEEEILKSNPLLFQKVFENHFTYQTQSKKKGLYEQAGEFVAYKYNPQK